jgi:flagellar assembly protein FliH
MEYFKPPEFSKSGPEATPAHEIVFGSDPEASLDQAQAFELKDVEKKKRVKRAKKIDYSQFSTAEFNEVDSLLTNVEEYTTRIREDAERYVNQVREEIDLLKSEIELELADALIKRLNAERTGAELIRSAEDSRNDIQKAAWEEGFQTGYAQGFQQFRQENDRNTGRIMGLLKELQGLRLEILQQYEQQIVRLSMLIARKVVHEELKTTEDFVLKQLKDTIHHFEGMGSVSIRIHPDEYDFVKRHQDELSAFLDEEQVIKVKPDRNVQPAAAIIETDFSRVDLELKRQLDEIDDQLRQCGDDRKILFRSQ